MSAASKAGSDSSRQLSLLAPVLAEVVPASNRHNLFLIISEWMRTSFAALQLGVSPDTLHRRRESNGGFLEIGRDYVLGPYRNSPLVWNVQNCRDALNQNGLRVRKEG
ncbi:hypothetical protein [Prochlorococcus marinus]|uniref:hypothetical protein n=1 Tax=Prochlorococcus marinus TaxID=1219 RepID=UPI001F2AC915|nr:hypothetical protein [Prochlorococcus marinus]